jgi:hypothetical protein
MEFFTKIANWFESTHIDEQLRTVDYMGLLTNPWFIVPFAVAVVYMLYKQRWTRLLITAVVIGVWYFSGTNYAQSLLVNGEIDIQKILPVMFGGAALLGFVIYLLFGRSD